MLNRFSLVPGSAPASNLFYWEPSIDGQLLRRHLKLMQEELHLDPARLGPVGKNVPVLVHNWPVGMTPDASVLLGEHPSELLHGRVPIYICAECGDLACGVVSAVIERAVTTVVWRDFGWDDGHESEGDDDSRIIGGPFEFDRLEYEAELRRFIETFDSVRNSLPSGAAPAVRRRQHLGKASGRAGLQAMQRSRTLLRPRHTMSGLASGL